MDGYPRHGDQFMLSAEPFAKAYSKKRISYNHIK
jgi:hypothetical protein